MDSKSNPSNPYDDNLLTGFSRSGLATYVHHKEMDVFFDLGFCPVDMVSVPVLFLTHTHLDHSGGIPLWLQMRRLHSLPDPVIVCPDECVDRINDLTCAMGGLNFSSKKNFTPKVIGASNQHTMKIGNSKVVVTSFGVDHVVPSVGYKVTKTTKKLRDDLVGADTSTIVAARAKDGDGIYVPRIRDVFTFIGDSRISTLENDSSLLDTDVLVMEATFLDKSDRAEEYGHTSLNDLVDLISSTKIKPGMLYMKHFSLSLGVEEIIKACSKLDGVVDYRIMI